MSSYCRRQLWNVIETYKTFSGTEEVEVRHYCKEIDKIMTRGHTKICTSNKQDYRSDKPLLSEGSGQMEQVPTILGRNHYC